MYNYFTIGKKVGFQKETMLNYHWDTDLHLNFIQSNQSKESVQCISKVAL